MKLSLTIIACGLLLLVIILTKTNNVYAEWIIPSQLNEAYKNAQHYSNSNNSISYILAGRGQDHNSTTTRTAAISIAIEKTPSSSVQKNK
jgi:hypothetical protein